MIRKLLLLVPMLAAAPFLPAAATEGGGSVYPYGLNTLASGILPGPGHYLYNYNSYFTADVTTDNGGDAVPIDFQVDVRVHTLRHLGVAESIKFAGGTLGWLVAQPWLFSDATVGPRAQRRDGPGDTTVGLMLGWHAPTRHMMSGVDVTLPTGAYSATRLFNPGRNHYAAMFYCAVSASLGSRFDSNLRANLTLNGENHANGYRSGPEAGLEGSINLRVGQRWLVGLNGYLHHQIGADELDGGEVPISMGGSCTCWRSARSCPTAAKAGASPRSGSAKPGRATRPKATSTGYSCSSRSEPDQRTSRRATTTSPSAPTFMSSA